MRFLSLALLTLALSGCTTSRGPALLASDWRAVATDGDRARLRDWRGNFARAVAKARAAGHGAAIDAEGRLLLPDAALGGGLPNGAYRCRIIKLGARGEGLLDYVSYPGFACRVTQEGALQYFAKLTGSQRPMGRIYPADAMRGVFLGVLMLGDESRPMRYGSDPERVVAGWVERIDERRWRIVLPAPRFESLTDVVELIPA
ncbi:MAG: DUF4893 domain-containing protein [Sphingomonas bacterium]|nr:DUF4893 domain-containing protein [Sphingomonas bacterium]